MPKNDFHKGAENNDVSLINSAASRGQDIDAHDPNANENTPLHLAAKFDNIQALEALLARGANKESVNKFNATPLHLAACNNRFTAVEVLCKNGAFLESKNQHGATPLHLSCECDGADALQVLMKYGGNINTTNKYGATPIFCAVDALKMNTLRVLLKAGAKVDPVSQSGNTALIYAIQKDFVDGVIELLRYGADINIRPSSGETVLAVAKGRGNSAIIRALENHIANPPAPIVPASAAPTGDASKWTTAQVGAWLATLNLEKYAQQFRDNAIDGPCLKMGLDDDTLNAIGVTLPIHRKKLQAASQELFGKAPAAAEAKAPAAAATPTSAYKYDIFLSHDWGKDELNRDNHARVSKINALLKARGVQTWFDNDRMTGDILAQMCNGVENSALFAAFITQRYVGKVASVDDDNCKAEFNHAVRQRGSKNIVPVVMEERMKSTSTWSGPIGMRLGDVLYVRGWSDDAEATVNQLISEIITRFPECKAHISGL